MDTDTTYGKVDGAGDGAPIEPIAGTEIDVLHMELEAVTSRNTLRLFWGKSSITMAPTVPTRPRVDSTAVSTQLLTSRSN